jgi:peptide chain release factor 2
VQAGAQELLKEVRQSASALEKQLAAWEVQRLLGGQFDEGAAIISINAGVGGDDANDWAAMLERMYLRWIEAHGMKCKVLDRVVGDVAGIKSVDLEVHGRFAFGLLYAEKGSHRLVRQSPFNAKSLRQTSFAAVDVLPVIEQVCIHSVWWLQAYKKNHQSQY